MQNIPDDGPLHPQFDRRQLTQRCQNKIRTGLGLRACRGWTNLASSGDGGQQRRIVRLEIVKQLSGTPVSLMVQPLERRWRRGFLHEVKRDLNPYLGLTELSMLI